MGHVTSRVWRRLHKKREERETKSVRDEKEKSETTTIRRQAAMFGRRCLRFRVSVHSSLGSAISVQFVTVNSALVRFDKSTSVSIDLGQLRSQLKCGSRCCLVQLGSTRYNAYSMACGFQILALKSYSLSSAIVNESDEYAIVKENFDSVRHQKEKHSMFTSVSPLGSRR
ncbi:hypothetical protein HanPSC8_Chr17g0795761 [Helianthus annuus]|nr:hypothetical protein HanPSC8_Chr17g0795761 [Helianthus annuus]